MTQGEIDKLLKAYRERGGLTRQEFCERRGMTLTTLDYYLRRYGKRAEPVVKLARVEITPAEVPARFTLLLANGRRVECGAAELAQLLRTAEAL
jgi:hypothetical protein